MRTAREVIAEAIDGEFDIRCNHRCASACADAALVALRAEGLVIVAAADVAYALDRARADLAIWQGSLSHVFYVDEERVIARDLFTRHANEAQARVNRLDAALAAGG